jgi:hypothetical protein
MQQLDIFTDSRDRALLNQAADALLAEDATATAMALDTLRDEFPADRHLEPAAVLLDALRDEARTLNSPLPDAAAAQTEHTMLVQRVAPAARTVLGQGGSSAWLTARWRALARRCERLALEPEVPHVHSASAWLQAQAWQEAEAAVLTIDSWRRRPVALAWMAQARGRRRGMDAAWPLLAELSWLSPKRVPAAVSAQGDANCHKLARRFEAVFEDATLPGGWAWWPAWLLTEQPLLSGALGGAQTVSEGEPEQAFRVMRSLLHLERQGRHAERVEQRRRLQSINPALLAAHLATR